MILLLEFYKYVTELYRSQLTTVTCSDFYVSISWNPPGRLTSRKILEVQKKFRLHKLYWQAEEKTLQTFYFDEFVCPVTWDWRLETDQWGLTHHHHQELGIFQMITLTMTADSSCFLTIPNRFTNSYRGHLLVFHSFHEWQLNSAILLVMIHSRSTREIELCHRQSHSHMSPQINHREQHGQQVTP